MRSRLRQLSLCLLVSLAGATHGQVVAPLPPRILDDEPGAASLAELPEDRVTVLEEIVVIAEINKDVWRLPDLGATWRLENETPRKSRLAVRYLPLYDPALADRLPDLFLLNKQEERAGYLELFRIRFGREPRRTIVPTVSDPTP